MRFHPLGESGLNLPVVSFGAWAIGGWYWGGPDDENAIRAIHAALDAGITCIDTAPSYGMGHSELLVARRCAVDARGSFWLPSAACAGTGPRARSSSTPR